MTDSTVTPASDLFERVSVQAKLFRIWWEIVVLWLERRRSPLSSTQDMYPIVNRHYVHKAGAKSQPNPSYHLTNLKKQGLLRPFAVGGSEGVLEPVVDKVVMARGKVVFTPDMLERVREIDVDELLKHGIGVQPEAAQASGVEPTNEMVAPVAHEPCVVRSDEAVMIGPRIAAYAEAVMQAARAHGYAPMSVDELGEIYPRVNPQTRDHPAITYRLEQAGFMRMVSGKKMAGSAMRVVVFRPYRIRYSRIRIGEEIVPQEALALEAGEQTAEPRPEPVSEPTPTAPTIVEPDPPARERVEDSVSNSASVTDRVLESMDEQIKLLMQARRDTVELEGEKEERTRLVAELERIQAEIETIEASMAERRARIVALGFTL